MDSPRDRPSGIPRLSRLPVPRSSIPKPTPSTSTSRATPIRPKASRDSLGGGNVGAGELNPPKLRATASRDHLRNSISGATGRDSPLRSVSSRDQLRSSMHQPIKPRSQQEPTQRKSRPPSFQQRASRTVPQPLDTDVYHAVTDDAVFDQSPVQNKPSFSLGNSSDYATNIDHGAGDTQAYALEDNAAALHTPTSRRSKPRPSLSERTMETLAQIPSSPALSKKSSSFFEPGRPRSRAESGNSRPGSSYNSDGSGRASSRQGSRPSSSAGQNDPPASFRGSNGAFKSNLSTISGTPRRTSAAAVGRTPQTKATQNRASIISTPRLETSSIPSIPDAVRSPSPERRQFGKTPLKSGSKSVASRPAKPRGSTTGLFKKPSLPSMSKGAGASEEAGASAGSWDGSIPPPSASGPSASKPLTNRKSSAALRDQIAKAKAAKRAAVRQASVNHESTASDDVPIISNDGYGFGADHDDPFNLRKGEKPSAKVLQQRVAAARTTGRLNIAALGLKEIPQEVMKMYDLESVGNYGGSWAESVDLTRLVAADNEIESLDDNIFPDASPDAFDEQEEEQGNIFGGLETLDLHGNLLTHVPLGFRRLANLTSLNLVSAASTQRPVPSCLRRLVFK